MPKHKTEDYKLSAVKYYLKNDFSMEYVCDIFECKKQSLSRWVKRYNINKSIKQNNRKYMSYKITKQQVNYAIKLLKQLKRKILEKSKIINNFQIIIY